MAKHIDSEVVHIRVSLKHLALAIKSLHERGRLPASKAEAVRLLFTERLAQCCGSEIETNWLSLEHKNLLDRFAKKVNPIETFVPSISSETSEENNIIREAVRAMEEQHPDLARTKPPEASTALPTDPLELELLSASEETRLMVDLLRKEEAPEDMLFTAASAPPRVIELFNSLSSSLDSIDAFLTAVETFQHENKQEN